MHSNQGIRQLALVTLMATAIVVPQSANGSNHDTLERETLRIIPPDGDEEDATYLLNGAPVDPETDSLGRFDAVASRFEDEGAADESGADEEGDGGTPRCDCAMTRIHPCWCRPAPTATSAPTETVACGAD